jgi:hypothetical protein
VDHIICDLVVHVLHQQLEEMEWNVQDKGIFVGHFISSVMGE